MKNTPPIKDVENISLDSKGVVTIDVKKETMDKILNKNEVKINDKEFRPVILYLGTKSEEEIEKLKSTLAPAMPVFQAASDIDVDKEDLKYQNGVLRTKLELWSNYVEHEGNLYYIQVDPLNQKVSILGEEKDVSEKRKEEIVERGITLE